MNGAARRSAAVTAALLAVLAGWGTAAAQEPLRVFVSVDMEGIGGVGTPAMTSSTGKDYALARRLMTEELNAVVEALFAAGAGVVVVNDSHGDHQNVLHTELDPRTEYIQGAIKPLGMVQGLDASFDAAVFVGYHAMAGDEAGFLAHTGSGSVKGLWINGVEVGEGGMNALFAGMHGVPVIVASGDSAFAAEARRQYDPVTVVTKTAVTPSSARMLHPQEVRRRLRAAVAEGVARLRDGGARPWTMEPPLEVRMRFASTTHAAVLTSIPGVRRVDGTTVTYTAADADEAYRVIRLMYRFVRP